MSTTGIKRSTALIAAVLGGQALALSIMLSAAWALSAWSQPVPGPAQNNIDCAVAVVADAPTPTIESRQLLNLSVGWLR